MTLASTRLFDQTTDRPYRLATAVEFIHTATLLHDDVVGKATNAAQASLCQYLVWKSIQRIGWRLPVFKIIQLMVEDGSIDVLDILSKTSAVIAEGEVLQLSIQNTLETTLDQYLQVISAKTAALFAAACEIGPVITGQPSEIRQTMRNYGHHVGMAFQIADDVLDYQSNTKELGKSIGDDFKEGKMTAPVIFAYEFADEKAKILDSYVWTKELTEKTLNMLKIDKTTGSSQKLSIWHKITSNWHKMPSKKKGIREMKSILHQLADYALTRKKLTQFTHTA